MRPALTVVTDDGYSAQIIAQMTAAGIEAPPDQIIADGRVHRFASTPGRNGNTGWYIVHPDPVASVWWFGDWRLGIKERHEGDPGRVLEPEEAAARKERLRDLRIKIAADEARFQAGAAIEARQRWDRCPPATAEHGYLKLKRIDPCGTRIDGDNLLVPMRDVDGKIWSLQEIAPDGRKHNQEGGRRKGCFFQIGELGNAFCVGEGFSTAATIHKATGYAVVSAGEAGNLEGVAEALRKKYPAATLVVCGDDDWLTRVNGKSRNVGKLAAHKAAEAVGGALALPWFGPARPAWATDFNDMEKLSGLDEVKTRIRLATIEHEEARQLHRDAEPPPATPEDFGQSSADESAAFSDDALALRFAEQHVNALRFTALWSKWSEWDDGRWCRDEKLRTMSLARELCRQVARGDNQ
jgi:putative DNA primase/helicase